MYRLLVTFTAAAVLTTGSLVSSGVEATPLSAAIGANLPVETAPIENVALCFYADGWNGPGLYECGFHRRQGLGWHGPRGGDNRTGRDLDRRGNQTEGRGLQTEGRGRH
jgi:hypothetical protein